jgi:hypothetical protein
VTLTAKEKQDLLGSGLGKASPVPAVNKLATLVAEPPEDVDPEKLDQYQRNVQRTMLAALKAVEEKEPKHLVEQLVPQMEILYKNSFGGEISGPLSAMMLKYNSKAAKRIMDEVLSETDDESTEVRSRRFNAVSHYRGAVRDTQIPETYAAFLAKEEDPFVAARAVFVLAEESGAPGQTALGEVIVRQINKGTPSAALGTLINLGMLGKNYESIFLKVLSESEPAAFTNMLKGLGDVEIAPASPAGTGQTFFDNELTVREEMVMDMVSVIKVPTVLTWCGGSIPGKNLVANAISLLNEASLIAPNRFSLAAVNALQSEESPQVHGVMQTLAGMQMRPVD